MWTGEGPRELRKVVEFSEEFLTDPIIQVTMSMWDMDQKTNQRADISAEMINREGFVIVFRTWGDTRVALPPGRWRDELSGAGHAVRRAEGLPAAAILGRFPVALLVRV